MSEGWKAIVALLIMCAVVTCGVLYQQSNQIEELQLRVEDLKQQQEGIDSDLRWLGECAKCSVEYRRNRHEQGFLF